jgi:aminoglycoside phosphotransferase (APT) family kinase protein
MSASLEQRLQNYIAGKMPEALDICVSALDRIPGGASRETYRFVLSYADQNGTAERKLILRRDMPSSMLESERRIEFGAYRAFWNTVVPVPEMLWLEEDPAHLDHPFFIAAEVSGYQATPALLNMPPYTDHNAALGQRKYEILGAITKADPVSNGYTALFEAPDPAECWQIELEKWAKILEDDRVRAEPIAQALIRWMRANPPPPAQRISVVHGDYRTGNFLFDESGGIHAILDWEMTHLGDPLEDLAWSFSRMWCVAKDDRVGGLLLKPEAIAHWEAASGLKAEPSALHWWECLAALKGQALWVSAARNWLDAPTKETIHLFTAWMVLNAQDKASLELMERL